MVLDPDGTSHSVLLLVTLWMIDITGDVIVLVDDAVVVLEKPDALLVEVVEYVIVAVEDKLKSGWTVSVLVL